MADGVVFENGDGAAFAAMLDEAADLYREIRAAKAHGDAPLFSRESFMARTGRQVGQDGFHAVWARAGGELVGFAFGIRFARGRWWAGNPTMPPPEILDEEKFAVIELNTAEAWRGRGIGRQMMDRLLVGRREAFAVLTAIPGEPARAMYERWGWRQVGTAQHAPDAPVMDQMVLRLAR